METKTYTTLDRAALGWLSGPWDGEPDKIQWPDEATGLPCLAVRHPYLGHWCGYVGVAAGHPMHGKGYEDVDIDAHGGLTFAEPCSPGSTEGHGVCHIPAPGEPEHVWWFGFDCAHSGDYSPQEARRAIALGYRFKIRPHQKYRTLRYVQQQCAALAAQLK